ncbi:hypothetical protein AMJ40_07355 [candidate division TA06 bacterium DG_26]|uniref:Uncharacterized protein n=1 Tax=candidate division TA06 bacterium DG_26 TaxID=1703771 RepID=A0A0S7WEH6_UNCT6|nr:MAG: hypothetical protein AMJ40_07355 [candidate division TA06 bacterium DG_26]
MKEMGLYPVTGGLNAVEGALSRGAPDFLLGMKPILHPDFHDFAQSAGELRERSLPQMAS